MSNTKPSKPAELSPVATEVLNLIKTATGPLTLAQIRETIPTAAPAHLSALRKRELINAESVDVDVMVTKSVLAYSIKE